MITGIIAGVILIAVLPPGIENGEWGAVAVAVVAALFFLALGSLSRESDRAYLHRQEYWAKSGKDRAKARHRWEAEARAEEEREMRERMAKVARRAERHPVQQEPEWQVHTDPGIKPAERVVQRRSDKKRSYTPINTWNAAASYHRMCRAAEEGETERTAK